MQEIDLKIQLKIGLAPVKIQSGVGFDILHRTHVNVAIAIVQYKALWKRKL